MPLKSCSRCGKIHPYNYKCNAGRLPQVKDEEAKFRSKNKWIVKSEQIRERSHWLCAVCKEEGQLTTEGLEVHHITKLRDAPELGLDDENLIALCVEHHKMADAGEIEPDYLRKLARKRDEGF